MILARESSEGELKFIIDKRNMYHGITYLTGEHSLEEGTYYLFVKVLYEDHDGGNIFILYYYHNRQVHCC